MALYTVHVPEHVADQLGRADGTVFVREGFSFWGFVFGWAFLLWHRLWAAFAVWLVLAFLISALAWRVHLPPEPMLLLGILAHLFIGVEGNDLRRWRLDRHHFRFADVVSGAGREEAEYSFFARPGDAPIRPRAAGPTPVARDATPSVIGMFPDEDRP